MAPEQEECPAITVLSAAALPSVLQRHLSCHEQRAAEAPQILQLNWAPWVPWGVDSGSKGLQKDFGTARD